MNWFTRGMFRQLFRVPVKVGQRWLFDDECTRDPFADNGFHTITITEIKDGFVKFERDKAVCFKVDSCSVSHLRMHYRRLTPTPA